ncbi:hypothetical protein D3C81_933650 [compost metagenome]
MATAGITLRLVPALEIVQLTLSPVSGLDRSRICRIWCDSSYNALRPSSGALPACDALPSTFSEIAPMPLVASDRRSPVTRVASQENTASCCAPSLVSMARAPGELISSSPLISTVNVP